MANEAIDWSRYMEGLQGKANIDLTNITKNVDFVTDYQVNPDGSWYRQWKSGWLEQGGFVHAEKNQAPPTVTFIKPYLDTSYTTTTCTTLGPGSGLRNCGRSLDSTTTQLKWFPVNTGGTERTIDIWWKCEGQGGV